MRRGDRLVGHLVSLIALTNTHSVGVVHDALVGIDARERSQPPGHDFWSLPVAGETWDGVLNDINGMHVRGEHVVAAYEAAAGGPVAEGNVGSGTGMICHEFKGGIGTASRVLEQAAGGFTVGVLVQANHGRRERLAVNGAPVGAALGFDAVASPYGDSSGAGAGSIIVIAATDAPRRAVPEGEALPFRRAPGPVRRPWRLRHVRRQLPPRRPHDPVEPAPTHCRRLNRGCPKRAPRPSS